MKEAVRWLLCAAASGLAVAAGFIYFGLYDVAASSGHSAPLYHVAHYAMRRSVAARTHAIVVPNLDDPKLVDAGMRHFVRYCAQCHGAPGVAPQPLAIGMIPAPTNLVSTVRQWPAADLYWVIKHGIKLTAMPAWNYQLGENELWETVAFLKALPALSPDTYAQRAAALPSAAIAVAGERAQEPLRPGNREAGRNAIKQYLCATCHEIPGFPGAENEVGPRLAGFAKQRYIGGMLLNTPENRVRWLRDPRAVDPHSAMPNLGLTEQDARDIAAYLAELR